jgi:hypothetical protein
MAEKTPEGAAVPADGEPRDENTQLEPSVSLVPTKTTESDLICGVVDRRLIEEFLTLVQKNYKRADMATFFLEQRRGVVNFQGITNVRDVLSHLVTLLSPDTPEERRWEQLHNAEEHLRRAINEPYEIALNELVVQFSQLYQNYKETVLPIKESHASLANAPSTGYIEETVRRVRQLTSKGRSTKSKNMWDDEWEEGVISFTEAYDSLFKLHGTLETYYNQAVQIISEGQDKVTIKNLMKQVAALQADIKNEGRAGRALHLGGYALAIIFFILTTIVALLLFILVELLKS